MCVEADGEHGFGEADAQDMEDMEKKKEDHANKHPTNVFQAQAICAADPFQATQASTHHEIFAGHRQPHLTPGRMFLSLFLTQGRMFLR